MLSIIFTILMFTVFGEFIWIAIKAAWGITKVLFTIVFLPVILIGMAVAGLMYIAFPLLIIVGIIALIGAFTT